MIDPISVIYNKDPYTIIANGCMIESYYCVNSNIINI